MYRLILSFVFGSIFTITLLAQDSVYTNSVNNMFLNEKNLSIRGYAQIDYNQPFKENTRLNGKLEVHRLVLFTGYRFNERLQFISEIEVEHGDQIFIEQAYAQYKINNGFNLRAGMVVIPMGIINEYHEPTTYHGVERPTLDSKIIPTTWRELAIGLTGVIPNASLRYQAYVTNGFLSHDGDEGVLRGSDGLRKGRQKGLRSTISSPNLAVKLDFFGARNLKIGLSGYFGKTQSKLYDGISKSDDMASNRADSSVVGISMISADARYNFKGWELRGVYVISSHKDAARYNTFTRSDLGSRMTGYYLEAAYDLLQLSNREHKTSLLPFIRYEQNNTHAKIENVEANENFDVEEITFGISWRHGQSVSFKSDYQLKETAGGDKSGQLNLGVGVWF